MKKIIALTCIGLFALQSCASVNSMEDFYTKYENQSTVIPLPGFALNLAAKNSNLEFLKYLKSARIFIVNDANENKQLRIIKDLQSSMKGDRFESLAKVKSGKKNLNISVLESGNKVNSMVIGLNGFRNVMVIDSKLNVTKQELEKVLEKISENDLDEIAGILGQ